ncbi:4Fe-4S dicluster domain-containing protein, partial [Eggerthella sinensis]|uniref:4Fe-4S dicluster domain-containing protein n=1 Tax=Eggerthella sinensis TaxID=242230 RepID=UPI0022DF2431
RGRVRPLRTLPAGVPLRHRHACGRCLQACPYGIVTPVPLAESLVAYGTPMLSYRNGCCDFCMKCVEACPTGALSLGGERERDLGVAVVVKDACVAWDWAGCTVCGDECPVEGAITLDEHDRPVVHADLCDGCGKCERVCPSASLRAYNAAASDRGIVVVSRASEARRRRRRARCPASSWLPVASLPCPQQARCRLIRKASILTAGCDARGGRMRRARREELHEDAYESGSHPGRRRGADLGRGSGAPGRRRDRRHADLGRGSGAPGRRRDRRHAVRALPGRVRPDRGGVG